MLQLIEKVHLAANGLHIILGRLEKFRHGQYFFIIIGLVATLESLY
jgi:hypothetical protein